MSEIPQEAIDAAVETVRRNWWDVGIKDKTPTHEAARIAIEAALPHLKRAWAEELLAAVVTDRQFDTVHAALARIGIIGRLSNWRPSDD